MHIILVKSVEGHFRGLNDMRLFTPGLSPTRFFARFEFQIGHSKKVDVVLNPL